jgi:hypothetical protein
MIVPPGRIGGWMEWTAETVKTGDAVRASFFSRKRSANSVFKN